MPLDSKRGDFRKQFLFVRGKGEVDPVGLPPGWSCEKLGAWNLYHGGQLPFQRSGNFAVLGLAHDFDVGEVLEDANCGGTSGEQRVLRLGGRFLLFECKEHDRIDIFSDPGGSLSCFLHPEMGWLASTPALIREVFGARFPDRPPSERKVLARLVEHSGTWYPAGLTELAGWELLPPSHKTEIGPEGRLASQRIWPASGTHETAPREVLSKFVGRLKEVLGSLASYCPLEIPVSAGRDSRMLLACSREIRSTTRYSVHSPHAPHHAPEVEVSMALAEVLDLDHHIDEARDPERVLCMGYGGEIARQHYVFEGKEIPAGRRGGNVGVCLAGKLGFLDAGIPPEEMAFVTQKLEAWAESLKDIPVALHGDLLYLEQRMATTMSSALYRDDLECLFAVAPLNAFLLYDLLFALPQEFRRSWKVGDEVFKRAWLATSLVPLQKTYLTGRERLRVVAILLAAPVLGADTMRAWRSPTFRRMLTA